jgi:hypothetical protein
MKIKEYAIKQFESELEKLKQNYNELLNKNNLLQIENKLGHKKELQDTKYLIKSCKKELIEKEKQCSLSIGSLQNKHKMTIKTFLFKFN